MTASATWITGHVVKGHGVASGQVVNSPYPSGTIGMQMPYFTDLGLDLSDCWPGTINVCFAPYEIQLSQPDHCFPMVTWTDRHPPETFSFWRIDVLGPSDQMVMGWIYHPHPETKQAHWQSPSIIEVLCPKLRGVVSGSPLCLLDHQNRIHLLDRVRLRASLLELLKFKVLASPQHFFTSTLGKDRREWLKHMYPQFLVLSDDDLDQVWSQARCLYSELD